MCITREVSEQRNYSYPDGCGGCVTLGIYQNSGLHAKKELILFYRSLKIYLKNSKRKIKNKSSS
jgi:hypothetical protein